MKRALFILLALVMTLSIAITSAIPVAANGAVIIVSDTSVNVTEVYNKGNLAHVTGLSQPAQPAWVHGSWNSSTGNYFTGTNAQWIWETNRTDDPASIIGTNLHDDNAPVNGRVVVFEKTFEGDYFGGQAALSIATDNCYEVYVNGIKVAQSDTGVGDWINSDLTEEWVHSQGWQNVGQHLNINLNNGVNTLKIIAGNEQMDGGTAESNPAGVIFMLTVAPPVPSVPELPAGALLGLGVAAIAGFAWFGHRKSLAARV